MDALDRESPAARAALDYVGTQAAAGKPRAKG